MGEKAITFEAFAKKAKAKIEERKKRKTKRLFVEALGEEIEVRSLSDEELSDCLDYSENNIKTDKYTIYYASQTLRELARYMKEAGDIKEEVEVCDMFSPADRSAIANEILALSGMKDKKSVSEVEELKKS